MSTPKLIFGGGALVPDLGYRSAEDVSSLLDVIDECGIKEIDTSALYGESEKYLGDSKAPSRFLIDTKLAGGGSPVPSTKDIVVAQGKESLGKLGTSQVRRSPLPLRLCLPHYPRAHQLMSTLAGQSLLHPRARPARAP